MSQLMSDWIGFRLPASLHLADAVLQLVSSLIKMKRVPVRVWYHVERMRYSLWLKYLCSTVFIGYSLVERKIF
jgi:hypothetical protein